MTDFKRGLEAQGVQGEGKKARLEKRENKCFFMRQHMEERGRTSLFNAARLRGKG